MTRCGLCSSAISMPVCPPCLTDKTESFVERRKLSLVRPYREFVRSMLDKTRYGKVSCVVCRGQNDKAVCTACFITNAYNWLDTKDKAVAKDFAKTFSQRTKKLYA